MSVRRIAAAAVLVILSGCAAREAPALAQARPDLQGEAAARGRQSALVACSSCHAIGRDGASRMPEAPPFREVVQRYPLDELEDRFAEGLVTSHPAMPPFIFRASEIDDLIAYLETLESEP